jgi:putative transcriptional regulator
MREISIRLGLLRVARGLTQQQLADATELRRDTISALERGKSQGITFDTLGRLCDALDCTPNDILALGETAHIVPVLGGEDEDEIIAERLAGVDLDALAANPALEGAGLDYGPEVSGASTERITLASLARALPLELLFAINHDTIAHTVAGTTREGAKETPQEDRSMPCDGGRRWPTATPSPRLARATLIR